MAEDAGDVGELREQDRYLPIANISRIMKKMLPENAKISKDAKETVQECVSEFICFITSEASDKCSNEKRKTINGEDILWSMSTLGLEKYVEPLKIYLVKYRESARAEKPDRMDNREESSSSEAAPNSSSSGGYSGSSSGDSGSGSRAGGAQGGASGGP